MNPLPPEPQPAHATIDATTRVHLMNEAVLNNIAFLVPGLVAMVLVPVMLHGLGAEAYGLWISIMIASALPASIDLGLGETLMREVAVARSQGRFQESGYFLSSVGMGYLVIGICGAVVIAAFGLGAAATLHLSPRLRDAAPLAFALGGISFCGDRVQDFSQGVFRGLRRFDTAAITSTATAVIRAAAIVSVLRGGHGIIAVAAAEAAATVLSSAMTLFALRFFGLRFQLRPSSLHWHALRPHLPFTAASQLAGLLWRGADVLPLIVGLRSGSAAMVPYYVGQKFPMAALEILGRSAQVIFPFASEHNGRGEFKSAASIIEAGTRYLIALMTPICIALCLLAPALLRLWVGETSPTAVLVLQLTTAAVWTITWGESAIQVLWSSAGVRAVLLILAVQVTLNYALSYVLFVPLGLAGIAWGTFVAWTMASCVYLWFARSYYGVHPPTLLRSVSDGLAPASLTFALILYALTLRPVDSWMAFCLVILAASTVYIAVFYRFGARAEEKLFLEGAVRVPGVFLSRLYPFIYPP